MKQSHPCSRGQSLSARTHVFTIATVVAEHEKNGPVIIFVICQHLNA
jgi:hypothetical protein